MIGRTEVIHTMHQGFRANDEEATILGKLGSSGAFRIVSDTAGGPRGYA